MQPGLYINLHNCSDVNHHLYCDKALEITVVKWLCNGPKALLMQGVVICHSRRNIGLVNNGFV